LSEVDQVLADPVGERVRLELVRSRLDEALQAPARRGGLSFQAMTESRYKWGELPEQVRSRLHEARQAPLRGGLSFQVKPEAQQELRP
jgi:hypothetical protein